MTTTEWRGKPVWIFEAYSRMMESLKRLKTKLLIQNRKPYTMDMPEYCDKQTRARKEHSDILVAVGICSHFGLFPSSKFAPGVQPSLPDDWQGGFLCPCHGSTFDLAGRVYKNKPAPQNLDVPRHMFYRIPKSSSVKMRKARLIMAFVEKNSQTIQQWIKP